MREGLRTLESIFRTTDFMMSLVLGDLDEQDARRRSRGDSGPSIAWTVGHLMFSRVWVMNALGAERDNPWEEGFGGVDASDGEDYPALGELREEWEALAREFSDLLAELDEADLERLAPGGIHGEQAVREQVAFFAWHEGYHMGVLGAIRKGLGYPGPAELVKALRQED